MPEGKTEIRVTKKVDQGDGNVDVTTEVVPKPKKRAKQPEPKPVPKGFGGTFVKRGGKLYPRGS